MNDFDSLNSNNFQSSNERITAKALHLSIDRYISSIINFIFRDDKMYSSCSLNSNKKYSKLLCMNRGLFRDHHFK